MKQREIEYFYENYLIQLKMHENTAKKLGKCEAYSAYKLMRQVFEMMYEATEKLWNEMEKEGTKND